MSQMGHFASWIGEWRSKSVQQEEVTEGDGTPQVPDHTESGKGMHQLPDGWHQGGPVPLFCQNTDKRQFRID